MDIIINESMAGRCIRDILTHDLKFSSNMIKKLKFSEPGITVNGSFVTVRYCLRQGDVLSLAVEDRPEDVSPYTIPFDIPIELLYEDDWITVINKAPGMPAHPSHGHRSDTVSNALAYRYRAGSYVFRPVNRLDRDTSGCMLTANSKRASYSMYQAMTSGQIQKGYIAVVHHTPPQQAGTITKPLTRVPGSIIQRMEAVPGDLAAKGAETRYALLCTNGSYSALLASPLTGRTHQIRVHMAGIGCPLVGDTLYGGECAFITRQALHSAQTVFPHPNTGQTVRVTAPLPHDMATLLQRHFPDYAGALTGDCLTEIVSNFLNGIEVSSNQ